MPTELDGSTGADSDSSSGSSSEGRELEDLRAQNTRLQSEVHRWKTANQKAAPYIAALMKYDQTTVDRILKGEALTAAQEKDVREELKSEGLTKDEIKAVLQEYKAELAEEVEQRIYLGEGARETRRELDAWAEKEFDGYSELKATPAFKRKLANNSAELDEGVENGLYTIPAKFGGNRWKWAIAQTMAQLKDDLPPKPKKVTPTKDELTAAKIAATSKSSGSSGTETEELPEDKRRDIEDIRRIGTRTIGKSYSRRA